MRDADNKFYSQIILLNVRSYLHFSSKILMKSAIKSLTNLKVSQVGLMVIKYAAGCCQINHSSHHSLCSSESSMLNGAYFGLTEKQKFSDNSIKKTSDTKKSLDKTTKTINPFCIPHRKLPTRLLQLVQP